MTLLREILTTLEEKENAKKKSSKKDKSAKKYLSFVSGNMMFKNTCSGELSGTKKK